MGLTGWRSSQCLSWEETWMEDIVKVCRSHSMLEVCIYLLLMDIWTMNKNKEILKSCTILYLSWFVKAAVSRSFNIAELFLVLRSCCPRWVRRRSRQHQEEGMLGAAVVQELKWPVCLLIKINKKVKEKNVFNTNTDKTTTGSFVSDKKTALWQRVKEMAFNFIHIRSTYSVKNWEHGCHETRSKSKRFT